MGGLGERGWPLKQLYNLGHGSPLTSHLSRTYYLVFSHCISLAGCLAVPRPRL